MMAIDVNHERLISLKEYAAMRPGGRNGRPMHLATAYRHVISGVRGIRLESIKMGGQVLTSAEAVQRFADRLTAVRATQGAEAGTGSGQRPADASSTIRTTLARRRAVEAADRILEAAGA